MPDVLLDIGRQDEINSRMNYLEGFTNIVESLNVFAVGINKSELDTYCEAEKMFEGLSALAFEAGERIREIHAIINSGKVKTV